MLYLENVQERFDVTKEFFHGSLLDVQAKILNELLVHGSHVFMHLNQHINLILGALIETVTAVKEKRFYHFNTIMSRTIRRVDESKGVSNRSLKATKQYFPVVPFVMLIKLVLLSYL